MIVPMKKISLVLLEKERKSALKALRKLGVVHVEEVKGESEELSTFKQQNSKIELALSLLSEIKTGKKVKTSAELTQSQAFELADKVLALTEEKKNLFAQITADKNELERFSKWGKVIIQDFDYLEEKGIYLTMFELPSAKYNALGAEVQTLLVNRDKTMTRFFVISDHKLDPNERPEGLVPEAYRVVLPRCSSTELENIVKESEDRIIAIDNEIIDSAKYVPSLKKAVASYGKDIELENLYSGMGVEQETEESCPAKLAWLTGYVPADDLETVKAAAKENSWAITWTDPSEDDAVPTKLKNNKLVSLIYPVTDFLGTVPGYNEYDISNWFLLFFTVFFGMIFGDGGYGALLLLAGLGLMVPSISKKQAPSAVVFLLTLLGFATMVWGAVTCTWFGLKPSQLPECIKMLAVPALSNVTSATAGIRMTLVDGNGGITQLTNEAWVKENLQIFCFSLALMQLSVAHLKGIVKHIKSPKMLGELGALLQLWGMFYVVLSMVVDGVRFPLGETPESYYLFGSVPLATVCLGCIGFGFFLSFIFSNYENSVVKSILESCKNIVSVLLGVVNVFSDIVSYIRLWAVALAGGAISATVNEMAGPLFGHLVMFVFAILLLTVGHGLNMILNVLSVIVHGVRLNTLEFSSHLGMSWTGFKYNPFKE